MANTEDKRVVSMAKVKAEKTAAFNRATYGEVIRSNRVRMGLSQPQLASILDTSKNYVSNWEMGRARPDMNMIPALCAALGITISEFFGVHGDTNQMTERERQHMENYILLGEHDRAAVDALTETLVSLADTELRKRCQEDFIYIFHNDNVAAAGTLNYLGDDATGEEEPLRRDYYTERADEIITVDGDSMEPTFRDGDDLLIEHTETLSYGEIGIFIINGEGFVKEYRENGVYSHNAENYPFRRFLPGDNVRIVGRVLGKVSRQQRPTKKESAVLDEIRRESNR